MRPTGFLCRAFSFEDAERGIVPAPSDDHGALIMA